MRADIEKVMNLPEVKVESLGEQEIQGRGAYGLHAQGSNIDMTVWADSQTALPVRIEYRTPGQNLVIFRDFEFNVEMAESLFSMEIPEGYTLSEQHLDIKDINIDELLKDPQIYSETSVGAAYLVAGKVTDEWRVVAGDRIVSNSTATLSSWPKEASTMTLTFPYESVELESVTFGDTMVGYSKTEEGVYQLEMPFDEFSRGNTTIKYVYSFPIDTLETWAYGYKVKLKFPFPVTSYKLTAVLEPDCDYEHIEEPDLRNFPLFSLNGGSSKTEMGYCALPVKKRMPQ